MLAEAARRMGAGRLLYRGWYAPRAALRRARREGAFNLARAAFGRAAMKAAALQLSALPYPARDAPTIYFLTGADFAYQTVFCAASLAHHAGSSFKVTVIDDGTLSGADVALLARVVTGVNIVRTQQIEAALDRFIPAARFPELRARRKVYPHLRKLTDVHALGPGWKLVLDSDMLFHGRPAELLAWLASPTTPCHMTDVVEAYGYTPGLLRQLAGVDLPSRVNVGLCGLNSDEIDWKRLETWCSELIDKEGPNYLLEQALTALLLAGRPATRFSATNYIVSPSRVEAIVPSAALHHYTAESKAWYFRFGWRTAIARFATGGQ